LKVNDNNIFTNEGNEAAEKVTGLAVKNKSILKQVLDGVASEKKELKTLLQNINCQSLLK